MDERSLRIFIGPRADYYFKKWSKVDFQQRANSWNWAAFFFSLLWLMYRKMYSYCGFFGFLLLFFIFTALIFDFNTEFLLFMSLLVPSLLGVFGNRIYRYHVNAKFAELYQANTDEEQLEQEIRQAGGVNWPGIIGFVFVITILTYLMFLMTNKLPSDYTPMNLFHLLF